MKIMLVASFTVATLSGCGGGNGAGSAAAESPVLTQQLAAYIGSWVWPCHGHQRGTTTITRASGAPDSIVISYKSDFYANTNCTGSIVGTWANSADPIATYTGTVDTSVTLGLTYVQAKVDKITVNFPPYTYVITGSGVTHTVQNGQLEWCVNYGAGNPFCIKDEGTYPAQTNVAEGLTIQGNTFYDLVIRNSEYTAAEGATRN